MADGKKTRRNNSTFRRICREEAAAGETVVVGRRVCDKQFPCLVNIHVLAGLEQPCAFCAPNVQEIRDIHGFKAEGRFWISDQLTDDQQQMIEHRIGQADVRIEQENADGRDDL